MNDKEIDKIIARSRMMAESNKKEFTESIKNIKKAQQNIINSI